MDNDRNVAFTFKALDWKPLQKAFFSPTYPIPWNETGFAEAECPINHERDEYPFIDCSCGIWSAWETGYAVSYRFWNKDSLRQIAKNTNVLSALFMGQPHGETVYDWEALTSRSQQYQLVAVVTEDPESFSAITASRYFDLPIIGLKQAQIAFDLRMLEISYREEFPFEPMYTTKEQLLGFVRSMTVGG